MNRTTLIIFCAILLLSSCGKDDPTTESSCSDGIQNGTEIGIDCGGSCAPCITCTDGIQNGNETGVDCGGNCPESCYGVGLTGEAGGIIFYDKGEFTNGWQYLEAALEDLSTGAYWDCQGTNTLARKEGLGEGAENVETVRAFPCFAMSDNLQVSPAVLQSYNYSTNNYTDWYLPSVNELAVLFDRRDLFEGLLEANYWSSTEATNQNVKCIDFITGDIIFLSKQKANVRARAIRKF